MDSSRTDSRSLRRLRRTLLTSLISKETLSDTLYRHFEHDFPEPEINSILEDVAEENELISLLSKLTEFDGNQYTVSLSINCNRPMPNNCNLVLNQLNALNKNKKFSTNDILRMIISNA